jgi:hypothetical protein
MAGLYQQGGPGAPLKGFSCVSLEERGGDVTEVAVSGLRFIDALQGNSPSCKPAAAGMVVQTGLGPQRLRRVQTCPKTGIRVESP